MKDPSDWPLSFEGKGSTECEEFIVKINRIAYKSGKHHDDKWIADFVYPCLCGRLLRWFEDLDEEVQSSWKLLRRALLDRYPCDE